MQAISLKLRSSLGPPRSRSQGEKGNEILAGARNLASSMRGLPEDLAVNPEYMEAFGH
jgi:hypothetical protein